MLENEKLEDAAQEFAMTIQTKEGTISRLNAIEWFKAGAKWHKKNSNINALNFEIDALKREIKIIQNKF